MKKAFLFALAALCVSAVQAVTTSWTTDSTQVTTTGTFTIALVVDIPSINNNTKYLTYQGLSLDLALGTANASNQGRIWREGVGFWSRASVVEGKNAFAFVFERDVNGHSLELKFYINDTLVNPQTFGQNLFWTSGQSNSNISLDSFTNPNGGTFYYMNGVATAEDMAAIPEPTALALLALGVAGLALKRKVA